jgi:hypothetical protein
MSHTLIFFLHRELSCSHVRGVILYEFLRHEHDFEFKLICSLNLYHKIVHI